MSDNFMCLLLYCINKHWVLQISADKDRAVIIETQAELGASGSTYFLPEKSVGANGTQISILTIILRRGD